MYSEPSKRVESFGDFGYATDLAGMGAYNDPWYHSTTQKYKCYACAFTFNLDAIVRFSRREGITLEDAGILKHITANPCCKFLNKLSREYQTWILSKYPYQVLVFRILLFYTGRYIYLRII